MDDRRQASEQDVIGEEHWTNKGDARLFLWEKYVGEQGGKSPTYQCRFRAQHLHP